MNKLVTQYISELLFLHDCVIIPEFGGFISNRKSAKLNRFTGTLNPPSKQILFNPNLKSNDGLLISHIAMQEEISVDNAKQNILQFVTETNLKLKRSKVLRLSKIGLFTVGKEGNIIFSQDISINYNLDSFGMNPTYNKSVVRKSVANKQINTIKDKIKVNTKKPIILLRAAAVIIPLFLLSYLSIYNQEKINNVYAQMASLNLFSSNENIKEVLIENSVKESINKENSFSPVIKIIKTDSKIINPQKKYYVIAGSFTMQKNANRLLKKLNGWNYNSEIVKGKNLLRVSYNSFYTRDDAVVALNNIKQENPDAWLLSK